MMMVISFFSKTVGILLKRNTEATFHFLRDRHDTVSTILRHFNTSAIMDLLMRLVTCTENPHLKFSVLKVSNYFFFLFCIFIIQNVFTVNLKFTQNLSNGLRKLKE